MKIVTPFDPATGILSAGRFIEDDAPVPENCTLLKCTERWAKPAINAARTELYNAATPAEQLAFELSSEVNVMVTSEGVYVKDIGDGEMRKITIDNGIVKIE